jgi:hypothetical protein
LDDWLALGQTLPAQDLAKALEICHRLAHACSASGHEPEAAKLLEFAASHLR